MQKQPGWNATFEFLPIVFPSTIPLKILSKDRSELKSDPITVIHAHDQLEVGYCYSGSGIFLVEGQVYPFSRGAVSVFLPGQSHRAQSSPGQFCQWNFFWVDLKTLLAPLPIPDFYFVHHPLFPQAEHPLLADLVRSILAELEQGVPPDDTIVKGLLWSVSGLLSRSGKTGGRASVRPSSAGLHRILPALDHIARHYGEPLSIPELASLNGMSPTSFRRHFESAVGQSPLRYLTEVRIQLAALMLKQEGGTILDTSLAVGYESVSTFYRQFHRIMGVSPQEWKRRSLNALVSTDTELRDMAAAAKTGFSKGPPNAKRSPAATGIPRTL